MSIQAIKYRVEQAGGEWTNKSDGIEFLFDAIRNERRD